MKINHINYIGPWNALGYGVASIGYLERISKLCIKNSINLSYTPIGDLDKTSKELADPEYQSLLRHTHIKPVKNAPTIMMWHLGHAPAIIESNELTGKKILITTFEVKPASKAEIAAITKFEHIIVASYLNYCYMAEVLRETGLHRKISIIPHKIFKIKDQNIDSRDLRNDYLNKLVGYNFDPKALYLSSIGKFEARKALPELIRSLDYINRPVVVSAFWYNPFIPNKFPFSYLVEGNWKPQITTSGIKVYTKGNKTIILFPPAKTRDELYEIAIASDYFISISKAEGFNLPLIDLALTGLPTISTTSAAPWQGGLKNYINDESRYINYQIDSINMEPAKDEFFFDGTQKWPATPFIKICDTIEKVPILSREEKLKKMNYNDYGNLIHSSNLMVDYKLETLINEISS